MVEHEGRSARKRQAILAAARTLFLRKGYAGTSMDEVAALAAVSKQTVYKNFSDKEQLFTDIIVGDISEAEAQSQAIIDALPGSEDVENDLRAIARELVTTVMQPHLVRMRRVIIGEADRFPDLARAWYERGPERGYETMADRFRALAQRGRLRVDDPLLAAQHFHWLVLSVPLNQAMFGADEEFPTSELERYADEGVRVFLAAYGSA
jgi:TetR/AcrR family transcriptional regulator, mexJK operon transcriptional repressor